MTEYSYELLKTEKLSYLIEEHIKSLAHPLDSWLEDRLLQCNKYGFKADGDLAGYCGQTDDILSFFYVLPKHFGHAPALMEAFISGNAVRSVFVMRRIRLCALLFPNGILISSGQPAFLSIRLKNPKERQKECFVSLKRAIAGA